MYYTIVFKGTLKYTPLTLQIFYILYIHDIYLLQDIQCTQLPYHHIYTYHKGVKTVMVDYFSIDYQSSTLAVVRWPTASKN